MNKLLKLIFLILLSLTVYLIYNNTNDSYYVITNIGDKLSTGTNSYGIKEKSYIDLYQEYLTKEKKKVIVDNTYSSKNQTISNMLQLIKENPTVKRKLMDSNILIITLGYNDLIYSLTTEEKNSEYIRDKVIKEIDNNYNKLINEIEKYYHHEIIVLGYYKYNKDKYINDGIIELNKVLKQNKKVHFIDTYNLLNNNKYFSNYNSYYPNSRGYYEISKKIISKTLEIS